MRPELAVLEEEPEFPKATTDRLSAQEGPDRDLLPAVRSSGPPPDSTDVPDPGTIRSGPGPRRPARGPADPTPDADGMAR